MFTTVKKLYASFQTTPSSCMTSFGTQSRHFLPFEITDICCRLRECWILASFSPLLLQRYSVPFRGCHALPYCPYVALLLPLQEPSTRLTKFRLMRLCCGLSPGGRVFKHHLNIIWVNKRPLHLLCSFFPRLWQFSRVYREPQEQGTLNCQQYYYFNWFTPSVRLPVPLRSWKTPLVHYER